MSYPPPRDSHGLPGDGIGGREDLGCLNISQIGQLCVLGSSCVLVIGTELLISRQTSLTLC